ncbi:hypothetical protein [Sphingobacterium athyrii]|uniref:TonB-dependent receptor-like beta-barrel domain-containing protein n=1 Tax=Sphingobacterium athyrii TaxID=2152717 RepID=A0A363NL73_9SPHI|nr:hypothetical protein [Sphingobacterium athyrii]PUV21532.1 hypothetical protein DCO56_27420 [Sphingobacterium athyrii]
MRYGIPLLAASLFKLLLEKMIKYISLCLFICAAQTLFGQVQRYEGKITDAFGRPLKDAAVIRVADNVVSSFDELNAGLHKGKVIHTDINGVFGMDLNDRDKIQLWKYPVQLPKAYQLYEFRSDPFNKSGGYLVELVAAREQHTDVNLFPMDTSIARSSSRPVVLRNNGGSYYSMSENKNRVYIYQNPKPGYGLLDINLTLGGSINKADDRVKLQRDYVQGHALSGQLVASKDVPYSWGPLVAQTDLPTVYNNKNIYRSGYQASTTLDMTYKQDGLGKFYGEVEYSKKQGVFDPNKTNSWGAQLNYSRQFGIGHRLQVLNKFNQSDEKMPMIGNNYANVLMGAYLSPVNFDAKSQPNANISTVYTNPWFLLKNNRDNQFNQKYLGTLKYEWDHNRFFWGAQLSYQYQQNTLNYGLVGNMDEGDRDIFVNRKLKTKLFDTNIQGKYYLAAGKKLYLQGNFWYKNQWMSLNRSVASFAPVSLLHRSSEFQAGLIAKEFGGYNNNWTFDLLPSMLVSNKSKNKTVFNFVGQVERRFDFDLFDRGDIIANVWGQFNLSHLEPNQINNDIQFGLMRYSIKDFQSFLPMDELLLRDPVDKLQRKVNYEFGASLKRHGWSLEGNFYQFYVKNGYAPIWQDNQYRLNNAVDYQQKGFRMAISSQFGIFNSPLNWYPRLDFHRYINKVDKIHLEADRIQIAGMQEISKNYIVGQPVGVIMGTAYARTADGQLQIDGDGYPIVAPEQKILGNPNPDFALIFGNTLQYRGIRFDIDLEWSRGGKVWNGTRQMLNYMGRSLETASGRLLKDQLFPGIDAQGNRNNKLVDYYDPAAGTENNRWVRYGLSGVAEDVIEDASYLRLSRINLSRSFDISWPYLNKIDLTLYAENLMYWSRYKGNYPGASLLGQSNAVGLDYFNSPLMRTFGFNVVLNF